MKLIGVPYLSPSAMSKLVTCQRQWWWHYEQGIRDEGGTEPLAMGSGLAHALEFGLEAGLAEYHASRRPDDIFDDPHQRQLEAWVGVETIRHAYQGYVNRYDDPGLVREETFIVDMPNAARKLQVRIDGVADGYGVEDKLRSGSSLRPDAVQNEVLQGRQITAECYCLWRDTGDLRPVFLRTTKKCDPRKWKSCQSHEEVAEVIGDHFAGDVFAEYECTRTLDQLREFEAEFAQLSALAEALAQSGDPVGVRNEKACHEFGRVCPALAACQGQAAAEELMTNNQEESLC